MNKEKQVFVDIENTRNPEQKAWYQKIIDEGVDPFEEKYFKTNHPHPIIFENFSWMITNNAVPYEGSKHHFIIIPKFFTKNLENIPISLWGDLLQIIKFIQKKFNFDAYVFFVRTGDTQKTGASVVRLHAHIIVPECTDNQRVSVYPKIDKK